jgi:hypothetical protein
VHFINLLTAAIGTAIVLLVKVGDRLIQVVPQNVHSGPVIVIDLAPA